MAALRMVQCYECTHGKFMQWMKNPIICECQIYNDRFVAEAKRVCPVFQKSNKPKPSIEHFDHY